MSSRNPPRREFGQRMRAYPHATMPMRLLKRAEQWVHEDGAGHEPCDTIVIRKYLIDAAEAHDASDVERLTALACVFIAVRDERDAQRSGVWPATRHQCRLALHLAATLCEQYDKGSIVNVRV